MARAVLENGAPWNFPRFVTHSETVKAGLLGVGAILLTAILFVLCLPLGEQGYLAWFMLVPLMVATRRRGLLPAFLAGLLVTVMAAWLSSTGLLYAHHGETKADGWLYTGFVLYGGTFAFAFGVWGDRMTAKLPAWWFAAVATLLESVLLVKLPAHLALSQYRNAAMVQVASVGGIWLVSFLVWWVNFGVAEAFLARPVKPAWKGFAAAAVVAVLLGGVWLPGTASERRFAAVQQADIDEKSMRAAQAEATQGGTSLVVWPEFGGLLVAPFGNTKTLRSIGGAPLVTSFQDGAKPLPHNVAALFANGIESDRYEKRKLFGEETQMHTPGDHAVAVGSVGLNICFDSCFPNVIRDTARLGVSVIALPTIDPPSTNDFIAAMHAAYTPFRAAESGVAMVRADGYAFSTIVDFRGRIVAEAKSRDTILFGNAAVGPRWTISRWLGDWFLFACGGLVLWPLIKIQRSKSHATEDEA